MSIDTNDGAYMTKYGRGWPGMRAASPVNKAEADATHWKGDAKWRTPDGVVVEEPREEALELAPTCLIIQHAKWRRLNLADRVLEYNGIIPRPGYQIELALPPLVKGGLAVFGPFTVERLVFVVDALGSSIQDRKPFPYEIQVIVKGGRRQLKSGDVSAREIKLGECQ